MKSSQLRLTCVGSSLFRKDPFISKIHLSFCISGPDEKAIKKGGGGWRESNYTFH